MIINISRIKEKLESIASKNIRRGNSQKALAAINAAASLQYYYNQQYADEKLEQTLRMLEKAYPPTVLEKTDLRERTIIFYDGFGLDTRGLALIYLKALIQLDYHVIYITKGEGEIRQPTIQNLLKQSSSVIEYLPRKITYERKIKVLIEKFEEYKPEVAFFYTDPADVAAVLVFEHFAGVIERYQINLTDHAFWLGKYAFDYCIEFRNHGASISQHERGIDSSRLRMLPYYPYIDEEIAFQGFPFESKDKQIIFSGGSLYKTFDQKGTYYKIVEKILGKHQEVIFLYAGEGDTSQLERLTNLFPQRVYYIHERKDLYQLMKHSTIYLNTFPMVGALMMQYAAAASLVPLTLKREDTTDTSDILKNQKELNLEFYEEEELLKEVDRLLTEKQYLDNKRKAVTDCVINGEKFCQNLGNILRHRDWNENTEYVKVDTEKFRKDFSHRFSGRFVEDAIVTRENLVLFSEFPAIFFQKIFRKMGSSLKKGKG